MKQSGLDDLNLINQKNVERSIIVVKIWKKRKKHDSYLYVSSCCTFLGVVKKNFILFKQLELIDSSQAIQKYS